MAFIETIPVEEDLKRELARSRPISPEGPERIPLAPGGPPPA
jgi:hypothetical protein